MGVVKGISGTEWPKQGEHLGKKVEVCFNYDSSTLFPGKVVRDDMTEPFRTIIRLADGRHVLATECQYTLPHQEPLPELGPMPDLGDDWTKVWLEQLPIPIRWVNCCKAEELYTIADIHPFTDAQLIHRCHNLGPVGIRLIRQAVQAYKESRHGS